MARAALGLRVRELALKSAVSTDTIVRYEGGDPTIRPRTVVALRATLEAAGIEFIDQDGGGPGVRLREPL